MLDAVVLDLLDGVVSVHAEADVACGDVLVDLDADVDASDVLGDVFDVASVVL
jgi:hypothetical protein